MQTPARSRPVGATWLPALCLLLGLSQVLRADDPAASEAQSVSDPASDATPQSEIVDRIVAIVDDDPIFLSDVDRAVALERLLGGSERESSDGEIGTDRRAALDRLIAQRLRSHEVDRYELRPVPMRQVDAQIEALRGSLAEEAEEAEKEGAQGMDATRTRLLERVLERQGMTVEALRALLRRQLRILVYVEERLGPRVLIDDDAVRAYYDGEFRSAFGARDGDLPPLEEVEGAIRAVLRERALNHEIDAWTDELRREARVVDLLDRREKPLPPVVLRLGG